MTHWTKLEAFHAHLDKCEQCHNHPLALCAAGKALLEVAADAVAIANAFQPPLGGETLKMRQIDW